MDGALSEFKTVNATAVNPVDPNTYDMTPENDDVNPEDPEIDVKPEDSASEVEPGKRAVKPKQGQLSGYASVTSSCSSTCTNEEAKLAGLIESAAALQKKQELEMEGARTKAKLETLAVKAAIAEKRAQVKVLREPRWHEQLCSLLFSSWSSSEYGCKDNLSTHRHS